MEMLFIWWKIYMENNFWDENHFDGLLMRIKFTCLTNDHMYNMIETLNLAWMLNERIFIHALYQKLKHAPYTDFVSKN